MSKNRFNSPPQRTVPDYTPRGEKSAEKEVKLSFSNCMNCNKVITDGYYGRYGNGGVCSKTCDLLQSQKPTDGEQHEKTHVTAFNGRIFSPR